MVVQSGMPLHIFEAVQLSSSSSNSGSSGSSGSSSSSSSFQALGRDGVWSRRAGHHHIYAAVQLSSLAAAAAEAAEAAEAATAAAAVAPRLLEETAYCRAERNATTYTAALSNLRRRELFFWLRALELLGDTLQRSALAREGDIWLQTVELLGRDGVLLSRTPAQHTLHFAARKEGHDMNTLIVVHVATYKQTCLAIGSYCPDSFLSLI